MQSTPLSEARSAPPLIAPGIPLPTAFISPSQTNSTAGPSIPPQPASAPAAPTRRNTAGSQTATGAKRRRTRTPDTDDSPGQKKNRDGPKKKKANRACFHCQKAHLTCDDTRPCQRCIKRGIGNNCTEGLRKKAKYLLDEEELEHLKKTKQAVSETPPETRPPATVPRIQPPTMPAPVSPVSHTEPFPSDPLYNVPFDPSFSFGSEAANLEYSILSAILGNPSPPDLNGQGPSPSQHVAPGASPTQHFAPMSTGATWSADQFPGPASVLHPHFSGSAGSSTGQEPLAIQPTATTLSGSSVDSSVHGVHPNFLHSYSSQPSFPLSATQDPAAITADLSYPSPQFQASPQSQSSPQVPTPTQPAAPLVYVHPLQPRHPIRARSPPLYPTPHHSAFLQGHSGIADSPASSAGGSTGSQLQSINDRVTAPYDYTEGYHFLMKHLPGRFEKNDILRVVRALAIFRPSLIALQMPLSEDDEIFVERCFQRSLLELDKLISFSGTPTVAWRRTGEICLVAPEFSTLTEWSVEELLGKKKYIYELFENQSVVEYWENFATHAFENTTQSVYSHCVLLKPSGAPVPATFCFSIRRDIFDLPSLVIGQWLPLL